MNLLAFIRFRSSPSRESVAGNSSFKWSRLRGAEQHLRQLARVEQMGPGKLGAIQTLLDRTYSGVLKAGKGPGHTKEFVGSLRRVW